MSVLIKGMKMPESCHQCVAGYGGFCFVCSAEDDGVCPDHGRPEWCPLVELPPHGRLIDADELVADIKGQAERLWTLDAVSERDYFIERNEKFRHAMFKAWCESLFAYLDTRPAIIEREVAE